MIDDVLAAFTLLTRLPVRGPAAAPDLARAVWVFPLVGLAVGLLGAVVYDLAVRLGMAPLLAACWALAVGILATGAFHEDGLADVADGFGGGATAARKLEIMRDSRIGSYGALALLLGLLIRISALAAVGHPGLVARALVVAAMLGRAGMILLLLLLPPARPDGLAAALRQLPKASVVAGLSLAAVAAVICLPLAVAMAALLAACLTCLAVTVLAKRQIGGHTGDVLGAGEVAVECIVLSVIAACLAAGP